LLWIVGDARQFNERGATPTNMTRRNVLRAQSENDWHSLTLIHLLASLAALLHDLGKACLAFQQRLNAKGSIERNLYRRQWLGARVRNLHAAQLDRLLEQVTADWNELSDSKDRTAIEPHWTFPHGLPVTTDAWRKRAARVAPRLLAPDASANRRRRTQRLSAAHA
jgi:hypothetical protein